LLKQKAINRQNRTVNAKHELSSVHSPHGWKRKRIDIIGFKFKAAPNQGKVARPGDPIELLFKGVSSGEGTGAKARLAASGGGWFPF
jgi:hypothetical protein